MQAFKASANAPKAVALDELEEAGAMAVDEAAEGEGESPEEAIAGDDAAKGRSESSEDEETACGDDSS